MMHKITTVVLLTLMLTGCGSTVQGWEWVAIRDFCEQHNGVSHVKTIGGVHAVCMDGASYFPKARSGDN